VCASLTKEGTVEVTKCVQLNQVIHTKNPYEFDVTNRRKRNGFPHALDLEWNNGRRDAGRGVGDALEDDDG
jgi:hypothetical protein